MDICRGPELGKCQFGCFEVSHHKMYINEKLMKCFIESKLFRKIKVNLVCSLSSVLIPLFVIYVSLNDCIM